MGCFSHTNENAIAPGEGETYLYRNLFKLSRTPGLILRFNMLCVVEEIILVGHNGFFVPPEKIISTDKINKKKKAYLFLLQSFFLVF